MQTLFLCFTAFAACGIVASRGFRAKRQGDPRPVTALGHREWAGTQTNRRSTAPRGTVTRPFLHPI